MRNWRPLGVLLVLGLALLAPSDATAKGSSGARRTTTHSTSVRAPRAPRIRSSAPRTTTRTSTPRRRSPRISASRVSRPAVIRPTTPRTRTRTSAVRTARTYQRAASKPPVVGVARDSRGRIARSDSARRTFMRQTGYANGRPGYVVDHVRPLACGGADAPSNMQWQTSATAKAKDRVERKGC
jgi:hypothetical protein